LQLIPSHLQICTHLSKYQISEISLVDIISKSLPIQIYLQLTGDWILYIYYIHIIVFTTPCDYFQDVSYLLQQEISMNTILTTPNSKSKFIRKSKLNSFPHKLPMHRKFTTQILYSHVTRNQNDTSQDI
jgi:hypothetical protein